MKNEPIISIVMGSKSDFITMQSSIDIIQSFKLEYEAKVISAHRTPDRMYEYARDVEDRGIKIIIAGAGGAAHLPGMLASMTTIPVLAVPIKSKILNGVDSLLSIVQMPFGVPVATMAIGEAGAKNAALCAVSILALSDLKIKNELQEWRKNQTINIQEDL